MLSPNVNIEVPHEVVAREFSYLMVGALTLAFLKIYPSVQFDALGNWGDVFAFLFLAYVVGRLLRALGFVIFMVLDLRWLWRHVLWILFMPIIKFFGRPRWLTQHPRIVEGVDTLDVYSAIENEVAFRNILKGIDGALFWEQILTGAFLFLAVENKELQFLYTALFCLVLMIRDLYSRNMFFLQVSARIRDAHEK